MSAPHVQTGQSRTEAPLAPDVAQSWVGRVAYGATGRRLAVAVLARTAGAAAVAVAGSLDPDRALTWIERLRPTGDWAASNGPDDPVFSLFEHLDSSQPVVFGTENDDGTVDFVRPEQGEGGPRLRVGEIGQVTPLDAQFGVHPVRCVPDTLEDVLFANDDVSAYALIDAAMVPDLPQRIALWHPDHKCLFKDEVAERLERVAPFLVRLERGGRFTRDLFTSLPDKPDRDLYARNPAIFFTSQLGLADLWSHLRKFTRLPDDDGRSYYLRYWDMAFRSYVADNLNGPFPKGFFDRIELLITRNADDDWHTFGKAAPDDVFPHEGFLAAFRQDAARRMRRKFLIRARTHFAALHHADLTDAQLNLLYRQARDRDCTTERGIIQQMESLYLWRTHRLSETKVLRHPDLGNLNDLCESARAAEILTATRAILEMRE